MAHHNRTPQSVLDAPSRTVEVAGTPPRRMALDDTGKREAVGRAEIRSAWRTAFSEARRGRRATLRSVPIWESAPAPLVPSVEAKRAAARADRKAKQAEFRARQAASVWPDGNRRTLSKSARAARS